jgi:hypothetical protein
VDDKPSEDVSSPLIDETIAPVWRMARSLRMRVHDALSGHAPELRVAAAMAASELVENAIKYGDAAAAFADIRFSLWVGSGSVRIQVVNAAANRAGVDELRARIEEIERSTDKEALYLQRVIQALGCPRDSGNLGLYRIALEGGFSLECGYAEGVVTVSATRSLR